MKVFYVFNECGVCVCETSSEEYASEYADHIEGWYCSDEEQPLIKNLKKVLTSAWKYDTIIMSRGGDKRLTGLGGFPQWLTRFTSVNLKG